jgi:hypothetical protein
MKTNNRALLVASIASVVASSGCGRQKSYFTIDGIPSPPKDCVYSYNKAGTFISQGELYLALQKEQGPSPSYIVGLNLTNGLSTTVTADPAGKPVELATKNDIVVDEVDVDFEGDPGSVPIPSQVIKFNSLVPAGGGAGVPFNMLASTGAAAVAKITKNSHYYVTFTVKGSTQSGSSVSTDPFVFGLNINTTVTPEALRLAGGCANTAPLVSATCGFQDALPTCNP